MKKDRPDVYIPADQLIVGDQIVLNNQVFEIGRIDPKAQHAEYEPIAGRSRTATCVKPAQVPTFHLWPPGEVHGEAVETFCWPCIDMPVRVFKPAKG